MVRDDSALEAKVAALRCPGTYPHDAADLEPIETHMAWVFLAGDYAYKLKKPVARAFLDFSTLEARRRDAHAEVVLNRRLAPAIYLGVVPLVREPSGRLRLQGAGAPIDWLVRMRRLPRRRMLDAVLGRRALLDRERDGVAEVLAAFFRGRPPARLTPAAYLDRLRQDLDATHAVLETPAYGLPADILHHLARDQRCALSALGPALGVRVEAGGIAEGHGDLRPEHVCLIEPPVVIDCVEFSQEFRTVDALDELAFLALECERLHARDAGRAILDRCLDRLEDRPDERLIQLYMALRATLRAKIAVWHLDEADGVDVAYWTAAAAGYLRLARAHTSSALA